MFEGRYSLAVVPTGGVILPPGIRKEMHKMWGMGPALLCFGVQFLYVCLAEEAEQLLERLDAQLCAAHGGDKREVTAYFHRMEHSIAQLLPQNDGSFLLPRRLMEMLGVPKGGVLTLLGVEDHLELWNRVHLERQSEVLERLTHSRPAGNLGLTETPICLHTGETHCSLSRSGRPDPRRCGPCVYLRLP